MPHEDIVVDTFLPIGLPIRIQEAGRCVGVAGGGGWIRGRVLRISDGD